MTKTQYDDIAEKYAFNAGLIKTFMATPTLFKILGNIENKKILDVACGDGYLTRKISDKGANVTGCDISGEMIKIGENIEKKEKKGISYFVADASKLEKVDEFDVVVAGFLLHYSPDKETLNKMCVSIFNNLKSGGRFVTINGNPENPTTSNSKYGSVIEAKKPINEGNKLKMTFFNEAGKESFSFDYFYWSKETYENALRKAGFKNIKWHAFEISEEGIDKYGKEFWNDYHKSPNSIILEAEK